MGLHFVNSTSLGKRTALLSKISRTSPGCDNTPFWFFKYFAFQISPVFTKIIDVSVKNGFVPKSWKHAIITPVPKCSPVSKVNDLRPISVTSLLCRFVEKIIVRTYVIPAYCYLSIDDHYAYKPTGSTTCVLVDLTHTICMHLEQHNYVRCLMIDFSKAFDTIDHCILISKLK